MDLRMVITVTFIQADLEGGYSHNLGTTYDISIHNIVDKANYIFWSSNTMI